MKYLVTTSLLIAFLAFTVAPTVVAQVISTGTIETEAYDDGNIGNQSAPGFTFNGFNSLWGIGVLFAYDSADVLGWDNYDQTGATGWTAGSVGASTVFPFATLTNGLEAEFSDGAGVDVVVNYYWGDTNTDFIVAYYEFTNNTGGLLKGVVPGLFIDWDHEGATFDTNEAAWTSTSQRIFDAVTVGSVGVVALSDTEYSGWDCFHPYTTNDAAVYTAMTTPGSAACGAADQRAPVGFGAADLADGETRTELVALVAGVDEAGFDATAADAATAVFIVAIEPGPDGLPGTHNLSAVYPNPFNPQANFTLEVAEQQSVRIAVYDALGREVAMLFNGTLTAGPEHAFTIDGAGLPSGIYMVRATGEQFTDVRRVTLMK